MTRREEPLVTGLSGRRAFLRDCTLGLGTVALGLLGAGSNRALARPAAATTPVIAPPRARRVIYLHMAGSPSQLDLFDPKPKLNALDGKPIPDSFVENERFAFIKGTPRILGSPYRFARHGESGAEVSELLPYTAGIVDELTIVRSMHTEAFNHSPAQLFLQTGSIRIGRPALGSWITYGLGSEAGDLPGFVVLISGGGNPSAGSALWDSGFLPTHYEGVRLRSKGDPVLFTSNPPGIDPRLRRRTIDAINEMNRLQMERVGDPAIESRIKAFELAYRMQTSAPELSDLRQESKETLALYGARPGEASFANNCLLARRLIERGVRFVQLYDRGWDSHGTGKHDDLVNSFPKKCRETDQACAALVIDLKRRGLLDDTLVIWGGEFGRTPMKESRNGSTWLGRDHHPHCFTMWLAGGGVKRGLTIGQTDELGYRVTEDPFSVRDLQATILHLLGLDQSELAFDANGRVDRFTEITGSVMYPILA